MDVFVSYAREDRERIRPLTAALESEGLQIFWDHEIPPGETWLSFIGARLEAARVVIVAWSTESIRSEFVYSEAARARARGVLVPVLLDEVAPPLGLDAVHAANLIGWQSDRDPLPPVLLRTIRARLGQTAVTAPPPPKRRGIDPKLSRYLRPAAAAIAGAITATAITVGGWYAFVYDPQPPRRSPGDVVQKPSADPAVRTTRAGSAKRGECDLGDGIERYPICVYDYRISSAGEFPAFFDRWNTDELKMSYAGAGAFNVGEHDWALKFLEQSKRVGSNVWQSHQPYLIGTYCALNRPDAATREARHLEDSLKSDFEKGHGYLNYQGTLSSMVRSTGIVKAALGTKCRQLLDTVIERLLEYKAKAPSE